MVTPRNRIMIRTSERSAFKRCRQMWWWSYVKQLKPQVEAAPLRFGTLVHKALEHYYVPGRKRGVHPVKTFLKLMDNLESEGGPTFGFWVDFGDGEEGDEAHREWTKVRELGEAMLEGYVDHFKQYDREYTIISPERQFQRDVFNSKGIYLFTYVGTIDVIARHLDSKRVEMWDFKTAARISKKHLSLDEQSGSYWTYGPPWMVEQGILKPSELPSHIQFRFLRKAKRNPDKTYDALGRVLNKDGSISKQQPAPFFDSEIVYRDRGDRNNLEVRVKKEVRDMLRIRQVGDREIYKSPSVFNCAGCAFFDPCELHEVGANYKEMLSIFVKWNPYDAHEILAEAHG